jgi:hypothetical protein
MRDPGGGPETRKRGPGQGNRALAKHHDRRIPQSARRDQGRRPSPAQIAAATRFLAPGRQGGR